MTHTDIINGLLEREGPQGYAVAGDKGGRTAWGISERAHPEAWRDGPPSRDTAFGIYYRQYVKPFDWVDYEPLRNQLIDFAVTSGQRTAIIWLQRTMGMQVVDGIVGAHTKRYVLWLCDDHDAAAGAILNNALVAARLKFIDEMTDAERSQKQFEEGWENRALSFLVMS